MQIQEIVIKKYGCLQNKYYCLNEDWQVFYGDNESGKTTLCSFIISILYGFKQTKNYNLTTGDGGYLIIKSDNQLYKIERYYRKYQNKSQISSLDDDYLGSDDYLRRNILKNVTSKDFKQIFVIAADKLNFGQELAVSSWQELALSYAMSGSLQLYKLQNHYQQSLAMLYNPKNQTGKLIDLIYKLKELESSDKLVDNLTDNLHYHSYLEEIQTLEEQKAKLEANLATLNNQKNKLTTDYGKISLLLIIFIAMIILAFKFPIIWLLVIALILWSYKNKTKIISYQSKPETSANDLKTQKIIMDIKKITEQINELKANQRLEDLKRLQNKERINQVQINNYQKEQLINELKYNIQEFQKLQLKLNWLQDIKEQQRLTILPEVIKTASKYFKFLTQDKYSEVVIYENQIVVYDHKRKYFVHELSFSAKSQLLLCLKLAFIDHQEYQMPIIIDDAWQMYDSKRKQQVYRLLRTLDYQVISMTSDDLVLKYNQEIRI